jgi:DNA-binding NtrC family response regulator
MLVQPNVESVLEITHGADAPEPVAAAECSQQLIALAQRVAASDCTVLIAGESGTFIVSRHGLTAPSLR